MNILLIGGSRFMGPHIVGKLLQNGHRTTIFNTGNHPVPFHNQVRFIQGDRQDGFGKLKESFDVIIDTCAYIPAHIQSALEQLSCTKYVLVSTMAVYQKSDIFPLREDSSPVGPWPLWGEYNEGKRACEMLLQKSGIKHVIVRPVYVLGASNYLDREQHIYTRLAQDCEIVLPGDGSAIVQFVFVQDTANVIVMLAEENVEGVYNCCGDEVITLRGLVEEMGKIVGKKARIMFNPKTDGAHFEKLEFPFANEHCICSNEKIKNLGVRFTPLITGLREDYRNYYRNQS